MSEWHPICRADEIPVNGTRLANVAGREVALVRLADGFFALDDQCTHGSASLSDGALDGDEIECPFHGGRFNVRTGEACGIPCTANAGTHACRVENGNVLVAIGGDGPPLSSERQETLDVRVLERREIATDIVSLRLASVDGAVLPAYAPGAHIDVHLADGLVRQYSLCCEQPDLATYRIAVQREPASRGGSALVHAALGEGKSLRIGLPRNDFGIASGGLRHLLLAGGIGITPLLSMAHALAAQGQDFSLHHWVRERSRAAFADELQTFGDRGALHIDDEPATQAELIPVLGTPTAGKHLYVCGPRGFMEWVLGAARAAGWTPEHLHWEHFSPAASTG